MEGIILELYFLERRGVRCFILSLLCQKGVRLLTVGFSSHKVQVDANTKLILWTDMQNLMAEINSNFSLFSFLIDFYIFTFYIFIFFNIFDISVSTNNRFLGYNQVLLSFYAADHKITMRLLKIILMHQPPIPSPLHKPIVFYFFTTKTSPFENNSIGLYQRNRCLAVEK